VTENKQQNGGHILINPQQLKKVNPWTSLASFPSNIHVDGQNPNEFLLLFVREHKIILIGNLLIYSVVLFLPQIIRSLVLYLDTDFLGGFLSSITFFESKWWTLINLAWYSYILTGYFNIFFRWFYNINILTTERFMDIDFTSIFANRIESAAITDIEDIKDEQVGIIQSLFNMGNLTLLTASGGTIFSLNNVPKSYKIRDFIMDVTIQVKDKKGPKDD